MNRLSTRQMTMVGHPFFLGKRRGTLIFVEYLLCASPCTVEHVACMCHLCTTLCKCQAGCLAYSRCLINGIHSVLLCSIRALDLTDCEMHVIFRTIKRKHCYSTPATSQDTDER